MLSPPRRSRRDEDTSNARDRDTPFWVGCGAVLGLGRHMRINRVRRREYITLLGGAAAARGKGAAAAMPMIGFMTIRQARSHSSDRPH
jgi:hypothetical protein